MGVKTLFFLGLVFSALLMYFCINSKKDALYASLVGEPKVAVEVAKPVVEDVKTVTKVVEAVPETVGIEATNFPSFAYVFGEKDKVGGFLAVRDEQSEFVKEIAKLCEGDTCIKEIKYFDDVKTLAFTKEIVNFIKYAKEEKIKDFALYLDREELNLEGTLTTQEQANTLKPYIVAFTEQGYKLKDSLKRENLAPFVSEVAPSPVVTKIEKIEKKEEIKPAQETLPYVQTVEDAAFEINMLITNQPINFEYSSSAITQRSKETLMGVLDILLGLDNVKVEVAGYTDARGEEVYNKVLSQKRADSVRKFLIEFGISRDIVKSVGYGEEYLISEPEDIINRRVEIHLKEGE